jgi:death-on-curing protein
MNFPSLDEVIELHRRAIAEHGGIPGIRDQGMLESALHQPFHSFGGEDVYPTDAAKVSALVYSLVQNHPFHDGNKRVGLACLSVTLMLNGRELLAEEMEVVEIILRIAQHQMEREDFMAWIADHLTPNT